MRHLIAVTVLLLSKRFFPTTPLHPTRQPVDFGLSVRSPAVTTVAIAIATCFVATAVADAAACTAMLSLPLPLFCGLRYCAITSLSHPMLQLPLFVSLCGIAVNLVLDTRCCAADS